MVAWLAGDMMMMMYRPMYLHAVRCCGPRGWADTCDMYPRVDDGGITMKTGPRGNAAAR